MNILIINEHLKQHVFTLEPEELKTLEREAPDAQILYINAHDVSDEHLRNADVIFGWPQAKRLKTAVNLKWLHAPSAGIEAYANPDTFAKPGVLVTRTADIFSRQIAEHIIMLFLSLSRGMIDCVRATLNGRWIDLAPRRELSGSRVLIVGAGSIGRELAKQLQGFDCEIVGIKRDPAEALPYFNELYSVDELDAQLPAADYIALCLPGTQQSKGIIDYRRLKLMKPTAILTNVGRGNAIVSDDLNRALREGIISGAGLDVTDPEPLPEGNPLWKAPNIIITLHISGLSSNLNKRRFEIFCDLLNRYRTGQPMHSLVDFTKGY